MYVPRLFGDLFISRLKVIWGIAGVFFSAVIGAKILQGPYQVFLAEVYLVIVISLSCVTMGVVLYEQKAERARGLLQLSLISVLAPTVLIFTASAEIDFAILHSVIFGILVAACIGITLWTYSDNSTAQSFGLKASALSVLALIAIVSYPAILLDIVWTNYVSKQAYVISPIGGGMYAMLLAGIVLGGRLVPSHGYSTRFNSLRAADILSRLGIVSLPLQVIGWIQVHKDIRMASPQYWGIADG